VVRLGTRDRPRALRVVALSALAVAGASAPARAAEPTFAARQSPDVVRYPGKQDVSFTLAMTGGSEERSLAVAVVPPAYGTGLRSEGSPLGVSLATPRISVSGAARATRLAVFEAIPGCSPQANIFHGVDPTGYTVFITLPAGGRGALTVRYRFGDFAPWPRTKLAPTFLVGSRRYVPWGPRLRATRTGVRIDIRTTPASSPRPTAAAGRPSMARGRAIRIRGRTEPVLRGHWISLRDGPRPGDAFARVRTNSRGRFSYRWRPAGRGDHPIWAFYRSQAAHVLSDHACPRSILVR
jgi:hypothetical protein